MNRVRSLLAAGAVLSTLVLSGGNAFAVTWYCNGSQCSAPWGHQYDTGFEPVVASNGIGAGDLVGQHLGARSFAELWYNPGSWSGLNSGHNTGWPSFQIGNGSSYGVNYQNLGGDNHASSYLFYDVFEYSQGTIVPFLSWTTGTWNSATGAVTWASWGPGASTMGIHEGSCTLEGGFNPSVSLATNTAGQQTVVAAYNGYAPSPGGCCNANGDNGCTSFGVGSDMYVAGFGASNLSGIANAGVAIPTIGYNPSVAIFPITSGWWTGAFGILEVHQNSNSNAFTSTSGHFWYNNSSVTWDSSQEYDTNGSPEPPKVAVCGSTVVEVHNGGSGAGWMHLGSIGSDGYSVTWGGNSEYWSGTAINGQPSVSCSGNYGIETHADASGNITESPFYL